MKIIPFYTNETQLIKKAAKGNAKAQERIYAQHAPKMLGVCRQYVKDVHFAEDILVKGFLKVFSQLHTFSFKGSFEGWIRRIMVRESISYLRKQQFVVYDETAYASHGQTDNAITDAMDAAHIQSMIDALPQGYQTVFVLYTIEGYKHQEIAEMLSISESTSKSQLFKARKLLQEGLKQQKIQGYGTK